MPQLPAPPPPGEPVDRPPGDLRRDRSGRRRNDVSAAAFAPMVDIDPRLWPASEDVEATSPLAREPGEPAHFEPPHIEPPPSEHADADEGYDDEEEHFVPPPPPPLPRIQGPTLVALLAMVGLSLIHISEP